MAARDGDVKFGSVMVGQIAGMVGGIKTVEEIIQELVRGVPQVMADINSVTGKE